MTTEDLVSAGAIETIGRHLRAWRRYRRHTQAEVAAAVGITQASMSNYERGVRDASISTVVALSTYLDVAPGELIGALPPEASTPRARRPSRTDRPLRRSQVVAALSDFLAAWSDDNAHDQQEELSP